MGPGGDFGCRFSTGSQDGVRPGASWVRIDYTDGAELPPPPCSLMASEV